MSVIGGRSTSYSRWLGPIERFDTAMTFRPNNGTGIKMAATAYPLQTGENRHGERIADRCIFVMFGASGYLTKPKLLPALFHLEQSGLLPENFVVVRVCERSRQITPGRRFITAPSGV
jgi:Glucose-6-phosphate dehydrogenase, NAD binding domain